jgi:hypothetical protein
MANASLAPGPELRGDIVDRWDPTLLHLAGDAPVERGGVDDDGDVRLALVGFVDQAAVKLVDLRQVADDFCDAYDREVFGFDYYVAARGSHAGTACAEEVERGCGASLRRKAGGGCPCMGCLAGQRFDQLGSVHFAGGLAG